MGKRRIVTASVLALAALSVAQFDANIARGDTPPIDVLPADGTSGDGTSGDGGSNRAPAGTPTDVAVNEIAPEVALDASVGESDLIVMLESNADAAASSEVYMIRYDTYDTLIADTQAGAGFSEINISSAFTTTGLTWDGTQYIVMLESNVDAGANTEVYLVRYNSYADLIADTQAGAGFSEINISPAFTTTGLTWDGTQYIVMLESNVDAGANTEVYLVRYNSYADLIADTQAGAGFSEINISPAFTTTGLTWDGTQYIVMLESNVDAGANTEVYLVRYNSYADLIADTQAGAGFSELNISSAFTTTGLAVEADCAVLDGPTSARCDSDDDGVNDAVDNCPVESNPDQENIDADALGDICDPDDDNDGVNDAVDNCPVESNPGQENIDADGLGDACDSTNDSDVFVSLTPMRYADSRREPTFDGLFRNTGRRTGNTTWEIPVGGRGPVPADAAAVIMNLTSVNGEGPGFATAYPCGTRPNASSLNYDVGGVEPNELISKLSASGKICVFTLTTSDVIVDVVGYVPASSPYSAIVPTRFADSRNENTFDGEFRNTGVRGGGTVWEVPIAGRGPVPSSASTAVMNMTVVGGAGPGFATVYPCGTRPNASSLNYDIGIVRPNELVAELSPTGTVCIFTLTDVNVIVDVVGFLEPVPGYTSMTPRRYADSRNEATFDGLFRNTGARAAGTVWEIEIAGRGPVPESAMTAVVNLTVTGGTGPGFATVYPCGEVPDTSSLNYFVGTTRPNELVAKLSDDGTICVFTLTSTHVIVDAVGYG